MAVQLNVQVNFIKQNFSDVKNFAVIMISLKSYINTSLFL